MERQVLQGKVALITGAARGQGRSHALRLAEEGADIIAVDLCAQPETVSQPGSTRADLDETVRQIEQLDRRVVAHEADVRDLDRLESVVQDGVAALGRLDIVCANAGIWSVGAEPGQDRSRRPAIWEESIGINLTGVWNTLEATVPVLIQGGRGGAIVLTSSTAGLKGMATLGDSDSLAQAAQTAYTAAKHGVVGLMRNYALQLAPYDIRVNTVHPTGVMTPMIMNDVTNQLMAANPGFADLTRNAMDVGAVDPVDISNAILYLVSDAGRYVTGVTLPVDAGYLLR
jgi:SDR family mycofactocin-dependent oxidoreductase